VDSLFQLVKVTISGVVIRFLPSDNGGIGFLVKVRHDDEICCYLADNYAGAIPKEGRFVALRGYFNPQTASTGCRCFFAEAAITLD